MAAPARRSLSLAQQAWALAMRYPHVDRPVVQRGRLLWVIPLQPTPISTTYTIGLDYVAGRSPRLYVVDPELAVWPGDDLPHTFREDSSLCLYYDEFSAARTFIADALIPWASEWLLHYELWLATGAWHGGGIEHGPQPRAPA